MALISPALAPAPLREDADGVICVGASRVTLASVVVAYLEGASAEEIVLKYPTLRLPDVYAVLTHYLQNRAQVDAYLADRRQAADALQWEVESKFPPAGILERLLARRPPADPEP